MAEADFDLVISGGTMSGGAPGTGQLHIALASPLTGFGDYCRSWAMLTGAPYAKGLLTPTAEPNASPLLSSRSVSLRAFMRKSATAFNATHETTLVVKMNATASDKKGYCLIVTENSGVYLLLTNTSTKSIPALFGVTNNVWYHYRLDVIPVGTAADIVRVYTATAADPETWTLRHTEVVNSSDAWYRPWGSGTESRLGWRVESNNAGNRSYIDQFEVRLEDV